MDCDWYLSNIVKVFTYLATLITKVLDLYVQNSHLKYLDWEKL